VPGSRLTLHPLGADRECPREGEAVVVKPASRQQPRTADAKALKDSDPLRAEARVESYAATLTLYTRAGCPLCEEMAEQARARLGVHRLIEVDVDGDPALKARFGWDVPLLFDADAEICRHEFDAVAFGAWLERD
jgi:hypothetical protein